MPKDFDLCVAEKGRVVTIPVKGHPDQYLHICYDAEGKSHSGEVMTKKASENMMLFPISVDELKFAESGVAEEIQVLPVGTWKHPAYGKIEISEKDIKEFIKNFDSDIRKELPITEGHSVGEQELPAIGWFKQLINKGREGLWAIVEWTKEGMELLKKKSYKYFSPEFYSSYEDPETHKTYQNVLVGGALTNRPYFKGLQAIVLSELTIFKEMLTLEEILKKEPTELTDEETALVKEKKDELTDDQKESFKDVIGEGGEKTDEEKKAEAEKAKADADAKAKSEADAKAKVDAEANKGSETIVMSKESLKFLETQAQEGVKAMAILRKTEATNYAQSLIFSEINQRGKFLPKSQNKVVDFLLSLTEAQQKSFKEIVAELPQANLFSELGENAGAEMKATDRINTLVKEKLSKDVKLEYRQALEMVFAENPDLQKEYGESK